MIRYRFENWIEAPASNNLPYSKYWNDEEEEKAKAWYVLDGNFSKMEDHLHASGLLDDFWACIEFLNVRHHKGLSGIGVDLAAGTLWAVPEMLKAGDGKVEKIYCVEYSKHRILTIGPHVLEHYHVPENKVVLAYGSFYDLRLGSDSVDFAFLSAAFHHADEPDRLLRELVRVLKPGGVVIIIGEHRIKLNVMRVKHFVKYVISRLIPPDIQESVFRKKFAIEKLSIGRKALLAPDPVLGDHYYTNIDYRIMFKRHGFAFKNLRRRGALYQSFVLGKNT